MSTKIYTGYYMDQVPFDILLRECKKAREVVYEFRNSILRGMLSGDRENMSKQMKVIRELSDNVKRTHIREPKIDLTLEASFFCTSGRILVIIYAERRELLQALVSGLSLKYYGYWNNTDRDESCTEEEWEQRKRDWDQVLPGAGIPAHNSMNFTFLDYSLPWLDELLQEGEYAVVK